MGAATGARVPVLLLPLLLSPSKTNAQREECDIPDIDECLSHPCANGATCTESHNDTGIPHHAYRCTCLAGFANGTCAHAPNWLSEVPHYEGVCDVAIGGNCDLELNECLRDPCRDSCRAHGMCACFETDPVEDPNGGGLVGDAFYCDFEESQDDPCSSNPCTNGGSCSLATPDDGRYQWLLSCDRGVPVVTFETSRSHKEIVVYDGENDRGPALLRCGGYCGGPQQQPCSNVSACAAATGSGANVTVTFATPPADSDDPTAYVIATYECDTGDGGGRRRRAQAINQPPVERRRTEEVEDQCTSFRSRGHACDDGNPDQFSGVCEVEQDSTRVCESTLWFEVYHHHCTTYLDYHAPLATVEQAKAACLAIDSCGGVEDLYCTQPDTYPGVVDHYALCLGAPTEDDSDGGTCVWMKPEHEVESNFVRGLTTPVVTETGTSPYGTTYLLSLALSPAESSVYTIYASPVSPEMTFPAAYNSPLASLSGDIGIPPMIIAEDAYDSWLTVGNVDRDAVSSLGIDTTGWNQHGLTITNGAVFLMDPQHAHEGTALIAQITGTYGCAEKVYVNAQGKSADGGMDWEQQRIMFALGCGHGSKCTPSGATDYCRHEGTCYAEDYSSFTCECIEGYTGNDCSYQQLQVSQPGTFTMAAGNSSRADSPQNAYVCSCAPGFADGMCDYEFVLAYESECNVPFANNGLGNCDIDVDECVSRPCANNATCIESTTDATVAPDEYQCGCPPGLAGGFCTTVIEEYQARCQMVGGNCDVDINECVSSPCQNDADCSDSSGWSEGGAVVRPGEVPLDRYRCSCQLGFVNGICDPDYQASIADFSEYDGLCSVSTGGNCDVDVDECLSLPCQNGGTCSDSSTDLSVGSNAYHCECTGDWSTSAETSCTQCHIGKYFASGVMYEGGCTNCTAGTFSDTPGTVVCTSCSPGRFVSTSGSDSESLCGMCPLGHYSDAGADHCLRCPAGQFQNDTGMATCIRCSAGSTTNTFNEPGAVMCTACTAGQYSARSTTHCAECLPGSITNTLTRTGATTCTACTAGQYSAVATANCAICERGSVTDTLTRSGAALCTLCSAGQFSERATVGCAQCQAGRYSEPGSTKCIACGRQFCVFTPSGANYSTDCSGPQWVTNLDQSSCEACSAGTEPSGDRSVCAPCSSGLASEDGIQCLMCNATNVNHNQSTVSNDFKTACVPCLPGFGANRYASQCDPCPAQHYAPCSGSGCQLCARGLLVNEDRTGCFPAYQCPAAYGCPLGEPCFTARDCEQCAPGSVSAGGEPCSNCTDNGPGWVASPHQTECVQCSPGKEPTEDRSGCRSCQLDYISILGSECQPCSATQIANSGHTKCVDCADGEVAANGVCACASGFYNSSNARIICGSLCDMNTEGSGSSHAGTVESVSVCSKCPPCARCPTGSNGLSSTPLINPGFGLPLAYEGRSLEELISVDTFAFRAVRDVVIYDCPRAEFCAGDHFVVDRNLVTADNIDRVLENEWSIQSGADLEDWRQQLISLAGAAGIRIEAASVVTQSTLGSSLQDFGIADLKEVLRGYYSRLSSEPLQPDIGSEFKVSYINIVSTVVVPDSAIAHILSFDVDSTAFETTNFSCAVGYEHGSPLCTLCTEDYAGGSTAPCKHCDAGTTGYRVVAFLLVLVLLYFVLAVLPPKLITKYKSTKTAQSRQQESDKGGLKLVGGNNTNQASIWVYMKIIASHFQVLLQFQIIMDIAWPAEFQAILDWMSLLKGDLLNYLNIKCAVRLDLYGDFAVAMLFVPFTYMCAVLFNEARKRRIARRNSIAPMEIAMPGVATFDQPDQPIGQDSRQLDAANGSGTLNNMFMVMFCVYPFLATRICHIFSCVTLHPDGVDATEKWQQYDYSIDCTGGGYQTLFVVAVLMFICYPIGVPVFSMWVFKKNWPRLHGLQSAPIIRQQFRLDGSVIVETIPWWYGDRSTFYFMVRDYKPQVFYYDIIEFVRKFSLTGLLMIGAERGSVSQIVLGIILAFGFGLANAIIQPYVDQRTNIFRILADCSLFITLLIVLVLHFDSELDGTCEFLTKTKLQWILIGANFLLLIVGANQELLRRLLNLYHQTHQVGILYNPKEMVLDGEGGYATVYRGQYRATVSAKEVSAAVKARVFDSVIEVVEIALMLECTHPNIVKLFKSQQDGEKSYLAMELGECSVEAAFAGFTVGREVKKLDPIATCKGITEGVQHMHTAGFVHGNITPANVIVVGSTPKLCGFSCTRKVEATVATQMNTVRGTRGYQPLEILARKHLVTTEVNNPEAVDVFGLGCTMFFILSDGHQAFDLGRAENLELNIETGASGVNLSRISPEAKHLLNQMLCPSPNERASLDTVLAHPLFWTMGQQLEYLGEKVASALPTNPPLGHKSDNPFVSQIEDLLDSILGPYNEAHPEKGGSWSRALDNRYPLTGEWPAALAGGPQVEEHNYHVFGAPPSKQQADERKRQVSSGTVTANPTEIRSVGLLNFIRNIYSHRVQQVEAGRFESETALCTYLLKPFPFLLVSVYEADARHRLTGTVNETRIGYGGSSAGAQNTTGNLASGATEDQIHNPLSPL